jgi:hypothetical protein
MLFNARRWNPSNSRVSINRINHLICEDHCETELKGAEIPFRICMKIRKFINITYQCMEIKMFIFTTLRKKNVCETPYASFLEHYPF